MISEPVVSDVSSALAVYNPTTPDTIPPPSLLDPTCHDAQPSSDTLPEGLPALDLIINPDRMTEMTQLEETLTVPIKEYIKNMNDTLLGKVLGLLKFASQPCFRGEEFQSKNLLRKCKLHGVDVDCEELFQPMITDFGICCGLQHPESFRQSKYLNMLGLNDNNTTFLNNNDSVKITPRVGRTNGLQVMVDMHKNNIAFGTVYEDRNGVAVLVDDLGDFPAMRSKAISLAGGKDHSLVVKGS